MDHSYCIFAQVRTGFLTRTVHACKRTYMYVLGCTYICVYYIMYMYTYVHMLTYMVCVLPTTCTYMTCDIITYVHSLLSAGSDEVSHTEAAPQCAPGSALQCGGLHSGSQGDRCA